MAADQQLQKMAEAAAALSDGIKAAHTDFEDLLFRTQRMVVSKNNQPNHDRLLETDLRSCRERVHKFRNSMKDLLTSVQQAQWPAADARPKPGDLEPLLAVVTAMRQRLKGLLDYAQVGHQHSRVHNQRVEIWYVLKDLQEMLPWGEEISTAIQGFPQDKPPQAAG